MPRNATKIRRYKRTRRYRMGRPSGYRAKTSWSSSKLQKNNFSGKTKALTGFPQRMTVALPYVVSLRAAPASFGVDQTFRMNSCFDPDFSGVGHQPRGWDQWSAVYNQYRVGRVDFNILVRNRGDHGIICRALANNESAALFTDGTLAEFANQTYLGSNSSNTPPIQRKLRYYSHKTLGKTWRQYISDENTAALVTTNPTEEGYVHFIMQNIDQTDATIDVEYEIQAVYRVTFFDHKNIGSS